jgi:autotransporter-associated beta strand protein
MPDGIWIANANANWGTAGSWSGGQIASGSGALADLRNDITNTRNVVLNVNATVGRVLIADANGFGSAKNFTTTTTTLTLNNGAAQPIIQFDTPCSFAPRLAGSNGVVFQTSLNSNPGQFIEFNTSAFAFALTGVVKVDGIRDIEGNLISSGWTYVYVGTSNAGTAICFENATSINLARGTMIMRGAAAYTMSRPFTMGNDLGYFQVESAGGVTFSHNDSVQNAQGGFELYSTIDAGRNGFIIVNRFPENANIGFYSGITNTTAKDMRFRLNTSGLTAAHSSAKYITVWGNTSTAVNARGVLEDNGLQTTYNSEVRLHVDSLVSIPLVVTGTNQNITFAGPIIRQGRTTGGVFAYPNATQFNIVFNTPGTVRLTGENNYNGLTSVASGTVIANRSSVLVTAPGGLQYYTSSLGTNAGGITVAGGGTLELTDSIELNKGTSTLTLSSTVGGSEAIRVPSGGGNATIICGGIALATNPVVLNTAAGTSLTLTNSGQMSGAGFGFTKTGGGGLAIVGTNNNFTGGVTIDAGDVTVTSLQNAGTNSTLGTGAATPAISLGGRLRYTGSTAASTNRALSFTGATPSLESSGTGSVNFSSTTATQAASTRVITLTGTNTGDNRLTASLSNGASGTVGITKTGIGKWSLYGTTLNYTGPTTLSEGTLDLGGINRVLSSAISVAPSTTLSNGVAATLQAALTVTGGTIRTPLAGTATLDVDSGAALLHVVDGSTHTGATTVDGQLDIKTDAKVSYGTNGKILGDSPVTVNGTLRTAAAGNQSGQARYGGTLTFNAGSVFHIGGA